MDILPQDVDKVYEIGTLFGDPVKVVLTKGGFYVFLGKKDRYSKEMEILIGSSHEAIGVHHLEKEFGNEFLPALTKSSESPSQYKIHTLVNKNNKLSKKLQEEDYNSFVIKKSDNSLEAVIYKNNIVVVKYVLQKNSGKSEIKDKYINKTFLENIKDQSTKEELKNSIKTVLKDHI